MNTDILLLKTYFGWTSFVNPDKAAKKSFRLFQKVRKKDIKIHFVPVKYMPRTTNSGKKLKALKDGAEAVWTLLKYKFKD